MANNSIPTNSGQLIGLAEQNIVGITTIGAQVPVVMVTAAQMQTALDAFVTQDSAFNAQRSARQTASDSYQAAMSAIYDWLLASSNVLANSFGTLWNTQWAQAGFVNHSTAIPRKAADQLGLALSLVNFFTANPGYEVASLKVTAAYGATLRTTALAAQAAVTAATVALNTIGTAWQTAYDTLTGLMRELIKNLEGKLAKNDPRWLSFGLQIPASIVTPAQPVNLVAHLDGTGAIIVSCDAVPLATRYRWRMLLVGVQSDYLLAARSVDPLGSIPGVLPGQTAQIIVQAVNGNLQGVASEPIVFTVPVAAKSSEAKAAEVKLAEPAHHTNGNGNGSHAMATAEALNGNHRR
ncbi:MAG: hypothetical protein QOD99_1105 [Chthoniobacter sp.]|nr:hypothetical protein [Chthoniobacter sp.]